MDDIKEQEAEMCRQRFVDGIGENLELVIEEFGQQLLPMFSTGALEEELMRRGYSIILSRRVSEVERVKGWKTKEEKALL